VSAPRATLVLVHGPGLGPWTWTDRIVPRLEALGLRCFAPDLHDAWPEPGWTPRSARVPLGHYVDRLHAVVERLPGPRILVGHSMGARIVEGLVARGLRDGAVLVAPAPPAGLGAAARALAARHPAALARALLARRPLLWFGEPGRADPRRVREALLHPGASDALAAGVAARLRDESLAACVGWLRPGPPLPAGVPVLLIGGREDPLVTPAALRHAGAALGAPARLVPHAGHLPLLGEAGEAVARHIGRWLLD
jgi:pimeloyl-ACP methyl ester carboxylesterase